MLPTDMRKRKNRWTSNGFMVEHRGIEPEQGGFLDTDECPLSKDLQRIQPLSPYLIIVRYRLVSLNLLPTLLPNIDRITSRQGARLYPKKCDYKCSVSWTDTCAPASG